MLRQMTNTGRSWAPLPLRVGLGLVFLSHGVQNVLGAFGGPGLLAYSSKSPPFGLWPGWLWMGSFAVCQLIGGLLLMLGLFTRIGAGLLGLFLVISIAENPLSSFFRQNGGVEFQLALLAGILALLILGGGRMSVDGNLRL